MYICLCVGVTTTTVQQAINAGARSTKQVAKACEAGSVCGRCRHTIRTMIEATDLDPRAGPSATPGAVIVAAIEPVGRLEGPEGRKGLDRLRASVHGAVTRLAASGVRRFWIYRALDDQAEVMILQEMATERQAEQWIRHPDAAAAFMAEAGVGAYPPLFVGRLVDAIEVPGT